MAYDPQNPKGHYNTDMRVPESVIQEIRDLGMQKSIERAKSGNASAEFIEGVRRFYPAVIEDLEAIAEGNDLGGDPTVSATEPEIGEVAGPQNRPQGTGGMSFSEDALSRRAGGPQNNSGTPDIINQLLNPGGGPNLDELASQLSPPGGQGGSPVENSRQRGFETLQQLTGGGGGDSPMGPAEVSGPSVGVARATGQEDRQPFDIMEKLKRLFSDSGQGGSPQQSVGVQRALERGRGR